MALISTASGILWAIGWRLCGARWSRSWERTVSSEPALFGSIVQSEMDEESDIDILIEFEGVKSFLNWSHLKNELEDAVNRVDEARFALVDSPSGYALRRIEIIGEAVKNLPDELKKEHPEVLWRDIAGLSNIVVHQYFSLHLELIWYVVEKDIPKIYPHKTTRSQKR
jgi:uncharacterized protein with HEPN domain